MRVRILRSTIAIVCTLAFISGCASKQTVKPDQKLALSDSEAESAAAAQRLAAQNMSVDTINDAASDGEPDQDHSSNRAVQAGLDTVYFDFDSHTLPTPAREILLKNAEWLASNVVVKVQLEGHTDERGSDSYNLALGERRGRSVLNYLLSLGVAADRLSILSYGEEKPAVEGDGEEDWSKNRRVEFIVVEHQ